ncbi:MAG: response regulator [Scytolyngbya sp. HA4215-MV1]|jgi:chemotaxis family two-component system sensor histidine kinase/response regulator PixL|nr:response regulator [Scytolyngbya sp. HA4215-MV1]
MIVDIEVRDQAYQFFMQESLELLQTIETGLLTLRTDQSIPKLHALMRAAHSIKGGAASLGLESIAQLSHRLEDIFRALYTQTNEIDVALEEGLLQAFDCLRSPLVEQVQTGQHDPVLALRRGEAIFAPLESRLAEALQNTTALPTAAELGVDIVLVVFSGDVEGGLKRLEQILSHPETAEVTGEIRAQAEVFVGIGELVNLPGFVAISRTTLAALDCQPDNALNIGSTAIADWRAGQAAVIAGDRTQGGQPSDTLLKLAQPPEVPLPEMQEAQSYDEQLLNFFPASVQSLESLIGSSPSHSPEAETQWNSLSEAQLNDELEAMFADTASFILSPDTDLQLDLGEVSDVAENLALLLDDSPNLGGDQAINPSMDMMIARSSHPSIDQLSQLSVDQPNHALAESDWQALQFLELTAVVDSDQAIPLDALFQEDIADQTIPLDDLFQSEIDANEPVIPLDDLFQSEIDANEPVIPLDDLFQSEIDANEPVIPLDDLFQSEIDANEPVIPLDDLFQSEIDANEPVIPLEDLLQPETTATELDIPLDDLFPAPIAVAPSTLSPGIALQEEQNELAIPLDVLFQEEIAANPPMLAPPSVTAPPSTTTLPTELPQSPVAPPPDAPYLTNAVRVDMARLERLNNLVGELVTQENSSLLDNQQLQSTLGLMLQRFSRFEQITKALQDWTDLSQSVQAHLPTLHPSTALWAEHRSESSADSAALLLPLADFDPLQMDSYSHLHTLVQESIEEIAQLGEAMRDMSLLTQHSQQTLRKKQQTLKQVRNDLLWARMLPLGDVLQRFPRMVRDLATRYHKQVTLKLSGTMTLVDKVVLEKLYDPLVHLVRNAFDHGIESPAVRQAQGKIAQATIEIRAYHRGNQTYIEVRDDGRGIDLEAVRRRLLETHLVSADLVPTLTAEQLYEYLFTPAFSTAEQVSELSGRGMGLETVRSQVKMLKGSLSVTSEPGQGTLFTLKLPLTLTIAKLLVFAVNGKLMALPIDTLVAILAVPESDIQIIQGRQFYRWQDQLVPLYPSSEFRHLYPLVGQPLDTPSAMAFPQDGKMPLLLIAGDSQIIALEVEHILQEQELVIKPFGLAIAPPDYLYGCTILGDGALVPVVDGPALVHHWLHPDKTEDAPAIALPLPAIGPVEMPTILVADDSLTARQTLALTLKKAGYRVLQARDGREALEHLRQEPHIQAVFCDVEMPQMNGFEFLNQCRQDFAREALPVIMLTSRSGEKHQRIAQLLGATAYLTKPYLEHEMLKTLKACLSS